MTQLSYKVFVFKIFDILFLRLFYVMFHFFLKHLQECSAFKTTSDSLGNRPRGTSALFVCLSAPYKLVLAFFSIYNFLVSSPQ